MTLPPLESAPPQNSGPTTNCSLVSPEYPRIPLINETDQGERLSLYMYNSNLLIRYLLMQYNLTGKLPVAKSVAPRTFPIIIYEEEHDVDI